MAFLFRLEHKDGTPADPPTLKAAVPDWRAGNTIALGHGRMLRVVDTRVEESSEGDPVSVLVVEETWPKAATSGLTRLFVGSGWGPARSQRHGVRICPGPLLLWV
jgi:hypothetical protein